MVGISQNGVRWCLEKDGRQRKSAKLPASICNLQALVEKLHFLVQRSSTIIGLKNRKDGDDREVTGSTSELHRRKSLQGMLVDEFPTHLAHQVDEDVQRNHEVLQLQRLFRPLFYFMGAFGLYHPSKRTTSVGTPPELRQRLSTRWLMIIAALCNMGYLVANFVVLIVANPVIDMTSLTVTMYIILLVWMTFAFLLAVLHFVICERTDRFDRIWELWARWARIPRTRNWVKMRRIRTIALVGAVTLVLLPTIIVAMGVSLRKPGELLEGLLEPVSHGSEMANHAGFTINFTLMSFTIYGTAVFTTVFFIIHCVIITDELKFLHKMIGDAIDTGRIWDNVMEDGDEISLLEQLRRRRLECHEIVGVMDQTFKKSAFFSVFANVPLIVFLAYGLGTHDKQDRYTKLLGILAVFVSLLQVLLVTVSAAWINQWAEAPKKKLHSLKVHNALKLTRHNQASLSLFLSELTSGTIGITAWDLVVITKEFVVTVFGLSVSYTIILVEFGHLKEVLTVTQQISERLSNVTTAAQEVVGSLQ